MWCVAEVDDEYVERMEDILDLYERDPNPKEPVVCLDEKPIQLLKNSRSFSRGNRRKKIRKRDYEYIRKGNVNAFCVVESKLGHHFVKITENRKAPEFAEVLREIGRRYPRARTIHLVMDNLNTHRLKSLTSKLGPKRGEKLWNRFTIHYTPKHASWLNQAETEISLFSRECLGKDRIATFSTLKKRARAWELDANERKRKIQWTFTTEKAREKFKYFTQDST